MERDIGKRGVGASAAKRGLASWAMALGVAWTVLAACAGPQELSGAQAPAQQPTRKGRAAPSLLEQLRAVKDEGSPLLGIDPLTQKALEATLAKLSAEERREVEEGAEVVRLRPLLHIAAGGVHPLAAVALSSGSTAADEVVRARLEAGLGLDDAARLAAARIAELSALRVVRDVVSAASNEGSLSTRELELLAPVIALLSETGKATRELERALLAEMLTRAPESATACRLRESYALDGLSASAKLSEKLELWVQADRDNVACRRMRRVEAARANLASKAQPSASEDTVTRTLALADAETTLRSYQNAKATLAKLPVTAQKRLDVAATLARAELEDSNCPGLPGTLNNTRLCALSYAASPVARQVTALLREAWKSGEGRTSAAVETFVGVVYVTPLLYGLGAADPALGSTESGLLQLAEVVEEAKTSAPRFAALGLYLTVLNRALQSDGAALKVPERERQALLEQARATLQASPDDTFATAAALAVASWLIHVKDVSSLLAGVRPEPATRLLAVATWVRLLAWAALARADAAGLEHARALVLEGAKAGTLSQEELSSLLVTLAECTAILGSAERKHWLTLEHLASQLSKDAPPEPSLEASVLRAVAAYHSGDAGVAHARLESALAALAPSSSQGLRRDLEAVVRALKAYFLGMTKSELKKTAQQELLAQSQAARGQVSPNTQLWLELMVSASAPLLKCTPFQDCALKASQRLIKVEERVGAQTANLLRRGVLPLGRSGLALSYSFAEGVTPIVQVDPHFLPVGP